MTDTQHKLLAAIAPYSDAFAPGDIMAEIVTGPHRPRRTWDWLDHIPENITELWDDLPLDAQLVAALFACCEFSKGEAEDS